MATRSNAKQLLISALNNDFLAEGFTEFLQTPLPEFDNEDMDATTAVVWEGKLSRYLCQVFTLFTGLFPLEIPLRMGQRNATQQAMLLASLQANRTVGAYYDLDFEAKAGAIKEQIEGVTPVDGVVSIDEEFWQQIYKGVGELLAAFNASPDATDAWKNAIQTAQVIAETMDGIADDLGNIAESTWRSLTSLSRLLLSDITGVN